MENLETQRLNALKAICLNYDPFNDEDRKQMLEEMRKLGIKILGDDPFSLSNQLLVLIDEEEQRPSPHSLS